MKDADLKARLKELYLPPTKDFALVDVPEMRYIMVDGRGAADRSALDHAVKWLFAAVYPIKRIARERMGKDFVEPPLEGLWWADDMKDFICGNRDRLNWRMMIVYEPDWLTAKMFDDAVATTKARLGDPPDSLRIESYHEGLRVKSCTSVPLTRKPLPSPGCTKNSLPAHNLMPNGHHHEIYLTDPNRVAPERMRTVLRQPVRLCRHCR